MNNQRFFKFCGLKEEEIETKVEELLEMGEIVSLSILPAYTEGGGSNFLAPIVSFRYTLFIMLREEPIIEKWTEDGWQAVD